MIERLFYMVLALFAIMMVASQQATIQDPYHEISTCQTTDIYNIIQAEVVPEAPSSFKTPFLLTVFASNIFNPSFETNYHLSATVLSGCYSFAFVIKPPKWNPFQLKLCGSSNNDDDHPLFS